MTIQKYLGQTDWTKTNGEPLYKRLRDRIKQAIEDGKLVANAQLPAEREITDLTGLSRVTVRRAMQDLVDDGIVVQRQGSGSFVSDGTPKVMQSFSHLTSFTEDMVSRGFTPGTRMLECGLFSPSPEETITFALSADEKIARIARLRSANNKPMAIERASIPADILPDPGIVTTSLYEVLALKGKRPVRAYQRISALNLGDFDAELLGVKPGDAGLQIEHTSYLSNRRVVEFTRSLYRGDAYDFVTELRLKK